MSYDFFAKNSVYNVFLYTIGYNAVHNHCYNAGGGSANCVKIKSPDNCYAIGANQYFAL